MKLKYLAYSTVLSAAYMAPVLGQTSASEQSPARIGLEEIVVVAQHRTESLQDVPIAISTLSQNDLDMRGVLRTNDLVQTIPGLVINRENNGPHIFLRSIGSGNTAPGFEQAVATYVDGVYYGLPYGTTFTLHDIERIEVLKGPQGTLFGRNTTGGLVHIITRDPEDDPMLKARVGYGRFNAVEAGFYGNTHISDQLFFGVTADWRHQYDGWGTNITTGDDIHKGWEIFTRGKLKWKPTERTAVTLAGDYAEVGGDFGSNAQVVPPSIPPDGIVKDFYDNSSGPNFNVGKLPRHDLRHWGLSATIEHSFGAVDLTSITGYRNLDNDVLIALTQTPEPPDAVMPIDFQSFTQEIRLSSANESSFRWMVGGFYYNATTELKAPGLLIGVAPHTNIVESATKQKVESFAGFAQATLDITSSTSVTAGARYTHETLDFIVNRFVANGNLIPLPDRDQTEKEPSFRFAIDQKLQDNILVYVSYNQSFRSGGYSLPSPTQLPVSTETVKAFELGFKSDWFDNRLRFNAASFFIIGDDIQQQQTIPGGVTQIFNAAKQETYGVEVDISAIPIENLTLNASMSFLDGEYKSFPGAPRSFPLPDGGLGQIPIDGKGLTVMRTPKFSGNFAASYVIPSEVGDFQIGGSIYRTSGYWVDAGNSYKSSGYEVVNASLAWTSPNEKYGVTLWSRNLLDKKYCDRVQVNGSAGFLCGPGEPLTYGVTAQVNF